jgi:hypothetical protein
MRPYRHYGCFGRDAPMIRSIPFFLSLTGCVQAPIAPNLKLPEAPAKECPKLIMPPIPEHVYLKIAGDKVFSDGNGDMLLRGYVRARELLR